MEMEKYCQVGGFGSLCLANICFQSHQAKGSYYLKIQALFYHLPGSFEVQNPDIEVNRKKHPFISSFSPFTHHAPIKI